MRLSPAMQSAIWYSQYTPNGELSVGERTGKPLVARELAYFARNKYWLSDKGKEYLEIMKNKKKRERKKLE